MSAPQYLAAIEPAQYLELNEQDLYTLRVILHRKDLQVYAAHFMIYCYYRLVNAFLACPRLGSPRELQAARAEWTTGMALETVRQTDDSVSPFSLIDLDRDLPSRSWHGPRRLC